MKLTLSVVIFALSSTIASAGVFDTFKADLKQFIDTFPAHEQDGYRDTGCDPNKFTDILKADGTVAYRNNPTCPGIGGNGSPELPVVTPVDPDPVDPVDPKEDDCGGEDTKDDGYDSTPADDK